MQISETGRSTIKAPAAQGFTLLELVVVIAIIGVTLTLARLVIPDRVRDTLQLESDRLVRSLADCSRGAVLSGLPRGIRIAPGSYAAVRYAGGWSTARERGAVRELPAELVLSVTDAGLVGAADHPAVVCLPSGETLRGALRLSHRGAPAYVDIVDDDAGVPVARWFAPGV